MNDLQKAKALLKGDGTLTCAFVCGGKSGTSRTRGILPLLELIEAGRDLKDWSAADKVVGRGAALLYVYLGVKAVFAEVMSRSAEEVFLAWKIRYVYENLVLRIVNRNGDGPCPMEQATQGIFEPAEGLKAIRRAREELFRKEN